MNKKVLFLLGEPSLPVNSGSRMRSYNFLSALKEGGCKISVAYLLLGPDKSIDQKAKSFFSKIWLFDGCGGGEDSGVRNNSKFLKKLKLLGGFFRGASWEMQSFDPNFEKLLLQIVHENEFDVVFCRYFSMAKYLIKFRDKIKARIMVDLDDIETIKNARSIRANNSLWTYRYFRLWLDNKLLENCHRQLKCVDDCIVCSEKDQKHVQNKGWNKNVHVIPNAIDVCNYAQVEDLSKSILERKTFLFCGDLAYGPNVEGLIWFCDRVWPDMLKKDTQVRLHIVGKNPDEKIKRYVDDQSVFLHPNVPDITLYYNSASAVIVPLHVAGGTRIKILEAFAARRPVVSTAIGAEGLGLVSGKHFLLADNPDSFKEACLKILDDFELAQKLTSAGHGFVRDRYDGPVVREKIQKMFN